LNVDQPCIEVRKTGKRKEKAKQEVDECFVENEVEFVCSHGAVDQLRFHSRQAIVGHVLDIMFEERRDIVDDGKQNNHCQHLSSNQTKAFVGIFLSRK